MFEISKIKENEIPAVIDLLRETWADTYSSCLTKEVVEIVTSLWHNPNLLNKQIENPDVVFLVARGNDTILGVSTVIKVTTENIVMGRLYVHPKHQGKGVGAQLYDESIKAFSGTKKVHVEVEENNAVGVLFYVKRGFSKVAMKKEDVEGIELKVIVMEKEL